MQDRMRQSETTVQRLPTELLIWLSPAFPVGGFAYSQALETAVARDWVSDRATLTTWLDCVISHGSLRNELILLSLIMRANSETELAELIELSTALQPSAERAKEACDQGQSFWAAYQAAWSLGSCLGARGLEADLTLTSAIGLAAREYEFEVDGVLEAVALAFIGNQVSAAIRLGAIGQFDGQRVTADLLPAIRSLCEACRNSGLDELGTATFGADLASLLHETQTTRLFRS